MCRTVDISVKQLVLIAIKLISNRLNLLSFCVKSVAVLKRSLFSVGVAIIKKQRRQSCTAVCVDGFMGGFSSRLVSNSIVTELKINKAVKMGSSAADGNSEFVKVFSAKANGIHPVTKYRSKSTGMEIVHAEIEGPMVNGYIVLGEYNQ